MNWRIPEQGMIDAELITTFLVDRLDAEHPEAGFVIGVTIGPYRRYFQFDHSGRCVKILDEARAREPA